MRTNNSPQTSNNSSQNNTPVGTEITDDDRFFAVLAYVSQYFIPFLIPTFILLSEQHKTRPFQRDHAVHALGLMAFAAALALALSEVYWVPLLWVVCS